MDKFEDPEDPEQPLTDYEPKSPTLFKGPELRLQARIEGGAETKKEK